MMIRQCTSYYTIIILIAILEKSFSIEAENFHDERLKKNQLLNVPLLKDFKQWMKNHNKEYGTVKEKMKRMKIWIRNNDYIKSHNYQDPLPSYQLGHNQFSDMTEEEFHKHNFLHVFSPGIISKKKGLRGKGIPSNVKDFIMEKSQTSFYRNLSEIDEEEQDENDSLELPKNIDWVENGAVTPVKNQGMCGACWAFSAVAAIEGAKYVKSGKLVSLSEQQLLDCDLEDHSCLGGIMDYAFTYAEGIDGFCKEEDWPYAMHRHHIFGCRKFSSLCTVVPDTKLKSYIDVKNTTQALKHALVKQPVSVAIQASGTDFQLYKSGVYDKSCGTELDHGVTAVGYGYDEDTKSRYWLIKNSWGEAWGESGYMKMSFKSENQKDEGQCGIQIMASRPIIGK